MSAATKKAAARSAENQVEPEVASEGPQYAASAAKTPTARQREFNAWLTEHTGYGTDLTTVMLVGRLAKSFRTDPTVAEARAAAKAASQGGKAEREKARAEKAEARAAALEAKAKAIRERGSVRGAVASSEPVEEADPFDADDDEFDEDEVESVEDDTEEDEDDF